MAILRMFVYQSSHHYINILRTIPTILSTCLCVVYTLSMSYLTSSLEETGFAFTLHVFPFVKMQIKIMCFNLNGIEANICYLPDGGQEHWHTVSVLWNISWAVGISPSSACNQIFARKASTIVAVWMWLSQWNSLAFDFESRNISIHHDQMFALKNEIHKSL